MAGHAAVLADHKEEAEMSDHPELLTLSEVSKRTKISMPTLQRYKKQYQRRIPSVGKGRKQRYPVEALEVFQALKTKNLAKRGRHRKSRVAAPASRKVTAAAKLAGSLVTLTEIGRRTGISYSALLRYVKAHLSRIPHEGRGRTRLYHPDAVEVFKALRAKAGRGGRKPAPGRRPGTAGGNDSLALRVKALEKAEAALERQIKALIRHGRKPLTVTINRSR